MKKEKADPAKKNFSRPDLAIFMSYIRPHGRLFAADMILSVLVAAVDLMFPYVTRTAMRTLLPQKAIRN